MKKGERTLKELQNVEQRPYDELQMEYDKLKEKYNHFQKETYQILEENRKVLIDLAKELEKKDELEKEVLSLKQSIIQLNEKNQELVLTIKRRSVFLKIAKKIQRTLKAK
jgi:uncharacterized protein YoxC